MALFEFVEGWYNPTRRHSGLGRISPMEFERRHSANPEHAVTHRAARSLAFAERPARSLWITACDPSVNFRSH